MSRRVFLLAALACLSTAAFAQQKIDYNTLYSYAFSVGFSYDTLTPYTDYGVDSTLFYGLSLNARVPLPFYPLLQPFVRLGLGTFNTSDKADASRWQNTQYSLLPGVAWVYRFSKNVEIGAEIGAGYQMTVFPALDPLNTPPLPLRTDNLIATAGLRAAFSPAFNFSIELNPAFTYSRSLGSLTRFDGLVFGLGFSAAYRFGEDPDAPQAPVRSIRFSEAAFPPVFAAMQSYYVKNPFTHITLTNAETWDITDLQVSFFQAGFMDNPTKLLSLPALAAGKGVAVDVTATFNNEVFKTNGVTPLTGQIVVEYASRNRAGRQVLPVSYDLYDKNAISWDDDRKEAAFITSADSALRNYVSFIRQAARDAAVPGYSETAQTAVQVFYALKEIGIIYQIDPTSPFTAAQGNVQSVDSVSLPRETLKRRTGDCDDLTALYCALLETTGIQTAFITVPGHIYAAFNTKVPSASYRDVHPDKVMTLPIEGELWVPVEITMIGTSDFLTAWRKGIEEFREMDGTPEKRGFFMTAAAQQIYRPVGLREEDLGLQYGSVKRITDNYQSEMEKIVSSVLESYTRIASDSGVKNDWNKLGVAAALFGRYDEAQKAFNTALSLDRNYLGALVNLGNVFFLKQDYQNSLRVFHQAEESLVAGGKSGSSLYPRVLLNISRSYYEMENYAKAAEYYEKAAGADPKFVEKYAYLSAGDAAPAATGRGAAVSAPEILFAGDGE
jgi:tetratricopeptide (TPR) repeat protein